jgi:catechol 2,3-dioxygenase-like lactoylglutathione lyase family enzyme
MTIDRIDHLVLTVKDIDETCEFYRDILGMEVEIYSARKKALKFGEQKLTIHQKGRQLEPMAHVPTPGSVEICFVVKESIDAIKAELENKNIQIHGIVQRSGAAGKMTSIYFRDPDENLIEVINYN